MSVYQIAGKVPARSLDGSSGRVSTRADRTPADFRRAATGTQAVEDNVGKTASERIPAGMTGEEARALLESTREQLRKSANNLSLQLREADGVMQVRMTDSRTDTEIFRFPPDRVTELTQA